MELKEHKNINSKIEIIRLNLSPEKSQYNFQSTNTRGVVKYQVVHTMCIKPPYESYHNVLRRKKLSPGEKRNDLKKMSAQA